MRISATVVISTILHGAMASAEWCDPPIAPMMTTPQLAKDFREEFKTEFDQYFRDASGYIACLDSERSRVFEEMDLTVRRYENFLSDKGEWDATE